MHCELQWVLLRRWAALSREYARTVLVRGRATSSKERLLLDAMVEDVRAQVYAAEARLLEHQEKCGCGTIELLQQRYQAGELYDEALESPPPALPYNDR